MARQIGLQRVVLFTEFLRSFNPEILFLHFLVPPPARLQSWEDEWCVSPSGLYFTLEAPCAIFNRARQLEAFCRLCCPSNL